jgi:hypothetical protein
MDINIKPIHPFPARMASEIALESLSDLAPGSTILDPMMGSGTTLKVGAHYGHNCIGYDLDPLSLLISKVWNSTVDLQSSVTKAKEIVKQARELGEVDLPWIDLDKETSEFINFWFAEPQKSDLRKLSYLLHEIRDDDPAGDLLRVAFSKLIITKDKGASLGRDISHSRPHKVRDKNDFQVFDNFLRSARLLASWLKKQQVSSKVNVGLGDARDLREIKDESVDFVITSPPYLHAVDYLRGHRLSLVWLGYKLSTLRFIRTNTVGIERKPDDRSLERLLPELIKDIGPLGKLSPTKQEFIFRYAIDLFLICKEIYRVLKPGKKATIVIADSYAAGNLIRNTQTFKNAAKLSGLVLFNEVERQILATRRYLPPPKKSPGSNFAKRMKTEAVLTFCKSK